jgi:ABC-2 type transport system ATP-binding protein
MEALEYVIEGKNLKKKYKGFTLDIPSIQIPKGFATALIGENGAGKTTLLNMLAGIRLDYKGELTYFGKYTDIDREKDPYVKEHIGYTGPGNYYLPQWTIRQVEEISELLFSGFDREKYRNYCKELAVFSQGFDGKKTVSSLSDGTKVKLMLSTVLARDTNLLLLDEPASPLDPLMRDRLCELIRDYLNEDEGNRSVFFSTHNISDMENVTDYCLIMEHGTIVEAGFVEDLKEKYVLVKGDAQYADAAAPYMYSMSRNSYGFEGICLAENLERLAGCDLTREIPTLFQISVAVMKANTVMGK